MNDTAKNAPTASPASPATPASPAAALPAPNPKRKQALTAVAAAVAVGGIAYGAYWALVLNHFETTDNAYVQGNVVQITPQVGGTVVAIGADDTEHVKAGQTLVRLDPADAQVALEQAEAQLAQTVREVRTLYVGNSTLGAQLAAREADAARAQSEVARAQDDVNRRSPLLASGAVGGEEFNHVQAQLAAAKSVATAAQSGVLAARQQLAGNRSLTDGVAPEQHPSVQRAAARVREATLALQRVQLQAPVDGFVAKRSVQLGQRVQAGAPLMSVIALDQVWVEANFKESQLKHLRIGQPVELVADVYGKNKPYHGTVEGLGAGTGAAFALLPAQNATGNWIKVVQRVPVRVALDAREVAAMPLRVGLSMEARVDISKTDGRMLADGSRPATATQTAIFDTGSAAADAAVQRILKANGVVVSPPKPAARRSAAAGQAPTQAPASATAALTPAPPAATVLR